MITNSLLTQLEVVKKFLRDVLGSYVDNLGSIKFDLDDMGDGDAMVCVEFTWCQVNHNIDFSISEKSEPLLVIYDDVTEEMTEVNFWRLVAANACSLGGA